MSAAPGEVERPRWHTLTVEDVAARLAGDPRGLSATAAQERLTRYGANEIESGPTESRWTLALRQVRNPLIYILVVAAGVSVAIGDFADAALIAIVVVINALIGFVQESRAREAMQSLQRLSAPHATVIREGIPVSVASRDVVPGDQLVLTSGDRISSDARLIEEHDLAVDESLLTGESVAVDKIPGVLDDPFLMAGDQTNMVFAGTTVVRGRGRALVTDTGATTEIGRIAGAVRSIGRTKTPLEESMQRFGVQAGMIILGLAALTLVVGLVRSLEPAEIFLTAVALAVATIPEGLPVVFTVTQAVGVRRMASRRAIVRSLPAVETLGSTTVIGSDKTGTLTQNRMTVRAIVAGGQRYAVSGLFDDNKGEITHGELPVSVREHRALFATLRTGVLASEISPAVLAREHVSGDPMEIALLVAAARGDMDPEDLHRAHSETDVLPFEPERRFMVSLRDGEEESVAHLKGAPEVVISRCDRQLGPGGEEPLDRESALDAASGLAAEGLRVLAMAYRPQDGDTLRESDLVSGFVLAGLVGMEDPLRPEAMQAVQDARSAGIRVIMLTGDHADTAQAIGSRLMLGDRTVSGLEIAEMSNDQLDHVLRDVNIFARVAPEHKLRIVQRLKAQGHVVAVTGDGVNDAPALRAAHLGVAMGRRGSDVAREAADIVLADDNFATITSAIEQGRIVFSNLRKVTFFLLSTAAGEILAILVALFAGWPLPFTAGQLLWINLVTDSLEDIALAFEPGEPHLLKRQPRPPDESILTVRLAARLALVGLVLAAATLSVFWWVYNETDNLAAARTAAMTQMVVLQFYHTFNCRSLSRSIFEVPFFSNRLLLLSIVAVAIVHGAALYTPIMQRMLGIVPLTLTQCLVLLVVGLLVIVGAELDKLLARRHVLREYA